MPVAGSHEFAEHSTSPTRRRCRRSVAAGRGDPETVLAAAAAAAPPPLPPKTTYVRSRRGVWRAEMSEFVEVGCVAMPVDRVSTTRYARIIGPVRSGEQVVRVGGCGCGGGTRPVPSALCADSVALSATRSAQTAARRQKRSGWSARKGAISSLPDRVGPLDGSCQSIARSGSSQRMARSQSGAYTPLTL